MSGNMQSQLRTVLPSEPLPEFFSGREKHALAEEKQVVNTQQEIKSIAASVVGHTDLAVITSTDQVLAGRVSKLKQLGFEIGEPMQLIDNKAFRDGINGEIALASVVAIKHVNCNGGKWFNLVQVHQGTEKIGNEIKNIIEKQVDAEGQIQEVLSSYAKQTENRRAMLRKVGWGALSTLVGGVAIIGAKPAYDTTTTFFAERWERKQLEKLERLFVNHEKVARYPEKIKDAVRANSLSDYQVIADSISSGVDVNLVNGRIVTPLEQLQVLKDFGRYEVGIGMRDINEKQYFKERLADIISQSNSKDVRHAAADALHEINQL